MDIERFQEVIARELLGKELARDVSARWLSRRLAEVIHIRTAWTFQKWFAGGVGWGHDVDLAWAALFGAFGKERLLDEILPHIRSGAEGKSGFSAEEWDRVRRIAQLLRRGRYTGATKRRFINKGDVQFLKNGEVPDNQIPLCVSGGPAYVSQDDVEQLRLFTLGVDSTSPVAFSYMDPIVSGVPGQPLVVYGVVEGFHEPPQIPPEYTQDRFTALFNAWRGAKERSSAFENRTGLCLTGVEPVLSERKGDAQEATTLKLRFSDYFKGRMTNYVLDQIIPGRAPLAEEETESTWKVTYRDEWCGSMGNFADGLANLMQVNGFLITTGDPGPPRLHLAIRGTGVATNPTQANTIPYAPSVSGAAAQGRYGERTEIDLDINTGRIRYDPQVTLLREAAEEIWGREREGEPRVLPESWHTEIRFLGLSRVFTSYEPFLFGHVELAITEWDFKDFLGTGTDKFDVERLHTISLDPESVLAFAEATSPIVHRNAGAPISVILFMLYHETLYRYPESAAGFTRRFTQALRN